MFKLHFKLLFTACFVLLLSRITAQTNLVPNPSFEDTLQCPYGDFGKIASWVNPTSASPDAFNTCSSGNYGIPNNIYGKRTAKEGSSYVGIHSSIGGNNYREYIQIQLLSSLQANQKYCVKFFVCLSDSASYAVNDIGAYFSNTQVSSISNNVLPYTPQAKNDPVLNPLTQRNIWQAVTDSFIAVGGEQYITIGNFKDDASVNTNTVSGGTSWATGYYYIDSVFVGLCSSFSGFDETKKIDNSLKVFPNPTSNLLNIVSANININKILLLDVVGNELICNDFGILSNKKEIPIDVSNISKGVYYLKVYSTNNYVIRKLIIN